MSYNYFLITVSNDSYSMYDPRKVRKFSNWRLKIVSYQSEFIIVFVSYNDFLRIIILLFMIF